MNVSMLIEMVGYLGSVLVVVSMLMSSVIKLRVINTIGSGIFAVYALIIHSYPTALMNFCLVSINVYNLVKLSRKDQSYDLIDAKAGDGMLHYILEYYKNDICKFFPGFAGVSAELDQAYVVCCNGDPAGVLLGREQEKGVVEVKLDYSVPAYRDCSVGAYLYSKLPEKGIHTLTYSEKGSDTHTAYLMKMGFARENGIYVRKTGNGQ
ncbi:MAG: YgjV family protein [Dorea sp.]|jgi:hypothetical protein|nr:YgjV family protein [Dorea sp.]